MDVFGDENPWHQTALHLKHDFMWFRFFKKKKKEKSSLEVTFREKEVLL